MIVHKKCEAIDGQIFPTEEECLKYEATLEIEDFWVTPDFAYRSWKSADGLYNLARHDVAAKRYLRNCGAASRPVPSHYELIVLGMAELPNSSWLYTPAHDFHEVGFRRCGVHVHFSFHSLRRLSPWQGEFAALPIEGAHSLPDLLSKLECAIRAEYAVVTAHLRDVKLALSSLESLS